MPDPVVESKLLPPRPRRQVVDRPRLAASFPRGAEARLVLVSAPAGFGKTTLVGAWVGGEEAGRRTAWVSLDEGDRDATTFWTYVLVAVDRAVPGTATAALAQLRSGRVGVDAVLVGLLNELTVLPEDLTIVLDDYHLADGPLIHPGMAFLVDHLPAQVQLVISTRADPALPLARLRARGQLVEVRAADLRFTEAEAGTYLNGVHGLGLPDGDVAALETRTEGWAAALQLAVLSLRGRDDPASFIAGFAGTDRFIVDYLVDEVLDRQPADVRRFLLETCVLDRMSGPLVDAVTGRADGRAVLATLERSNLFVVALDGRREWYRYHHLFADVLQAHLLDERPDDAPGLHRRACDWYDRHGDPERAVRHALSAGDMDRAAELVERAVPDLRRHRREAVLRRWAALLPPQAVSDRPVLAVGLIHGLMSSNDFEGVEDRLRAVERTMERPAADHIVVDRAEYARLDGAIGVARSAVALVGGDLPGCIRHAEVALRRATATDLITRASASALIGIAAWTTGDLAAAHRGYASAAEGLERAGHVADVLGCTITLADLEVTMGRLGDARRSLERALRLAGRADPRLSGVRGTADMHVGLARVAWESGDLATSADHLDRAENLGEGAGLPQNPYRWQVGMARLREADGDVPGALALLAEAERLYVGDFAPDVRPVAADRARLLACSGDLAAAMGWVKRRGLGFDDELTYLREHEHVTLARILLEVHAGTGDATALSQATGLLARLLAAAQAGGRVAAALEVLLLQARARDASGDRTGALAAIKQAVELAEPQGYAGAFTLDPAPTRGLLQDLLARTSGRSFLRRLLDAVPRGTGPVDQPTGRAAFVEPLSDRELDVLRLLRSELDGPAIARQLGVSLSTVRTHTQHVYTKLAVNNRRAAVRRAHQHNLFAAHRS